MANCLNCSHPKSDHENGACKHQTYVGVIKTSHSDQVVYASCDCPGFVDQARVIAPESRPGNG
jgi:hypothetical protein